MNILEILQLFDEEPKQSLCHDGIIVKRKVMVKQIGSILRKWQQRKRRCIQVIWGTKRGYFRGYTWQGVWDGVRQSKQISIPSKRENFKQRHSFKPPKKIVKNCFILVISQD